MPDKIALGGHSIELSHPDKILFPEDNITKEDLIDYYRKIADTMLPHLKDRPLVMHRFPDGIAKSGFIQQEVSDYFPDWIERVSLEKRTGGRISHVVCQNAATLAYLANQACITIHTWLSREDRLEFPDQLIFDLDPAGKDFAAVQDAALILRKFLNEMDLDPLAKTTGSRGLHVVVPLDRTANFEQVHAFAQDLAGVIARTEPLKLTTEQRKDKRKGRILLDYMRNSYGQTAVAPYAVRAIAGAPVAAPLDWDEVADRSLSAQKYTLKNIFQRLSRKKDPWGQKGRKGYSLEKASRKLNDLKKA